MALRICAPHVLLAAGMLLSAVARLSAGRRPVQEPDGERHRRRQERDRVPPAAAAGRAALDSAAASAGAGQRPHRRLAERSRCRQAPRAARQRPDPGDRARQVAGKPAAAAEPGRAAQGPGCRSRCSSARQAGATKTYEENIGPIRIGRDLAARKYEDNTANLVYGTEPERQYLYEPPVGYRRPAGSAPLGPGRGGPREDTQAIGQLEFATGRPAPTIQ